MNFKRILITATATVFSMSMILSGNLMSTAETTDTIKIMSIGDSITDGYGTDGSYRKFLYKELTDNGHKIDMVGPNWSWGDATYTDSETDESFTYDAAHCGYSGYAIQEYSGRSGILETIKNGNYLSEYTPDIVILQIGTNDVIDNHEIDTAGERLEVLADYILQNISEDSALFITTIPNLDPNRSDVYSWFGNYRHSADWQTNYSDEEVDVNVQKSIDHYNSQVKTLVEEKQASGVSNVYYGNVNSAVTDVKVQLKDGVHPNDIGYKLMGEYWANQIESYISGEDITPTQPTEPSTEEATEPTEFVTTSVTTSIETTTTVVTDPTEPADTTTVTEFIQPEESSTVTTVPETTEPTNTTVTDILGDVNNDTEVNIADAVALSLYLTCDGTLNNNMACCDVLADGKINVFDLIALKRLLIEIK